MKKMCSNKQSVIRRRIVGRGFEKLERRQVLAAELCQAIESAEFTAEARLGSDPTGIATHYYMNGAEAIALSIHQDRIAIRLSDGEQRGEILEGLTKRRTVAGDVDIFSGEGIGTEEERARFVEAFGAESIYPVFYSTSQGSEAVLLDEVIVSLQPGVSEVEYFGGNELFSSHRPLRGTSNQFIGTVAAGSGELALQVSNELARDERLVWAAPNFYQDWQKYYAPVDPLITNQWHLNNTGQGGGVVDADSDLFEAWDVQQGGSTDIVIGIIDDGVDAHPDLLRWENLGEVASNGIDDDGNGWIDDVYGWNFVADNNASHSTTTVDKHGTSVAGVAAALGDNGIGVAGASYGSPVLSARIFEGNDVASDAAIAEAIYYALGRKADGSGSWNAAQILNNSWGGGFPATVIIDAFAWGASASNGGNGAAIFIASGNDFSSEISFPADQAAFIPGVVAVGATNNHGERSNYSNYGTALDFVAPSSDTRMGYLAIETTDREGANGYNVLGDYTGNGATGFGGTSSATPLAAGIGALVLARADALSIPMNAATLRDYLRNNTDQIGGEYSQITGKNLEFGYGRLNAASALSHLGTAEISVVSGYGEMVSGVGSTGPDISPVGKTTDFAVRVRNQGSEPLDLLSAAVDAGPFQVIGFEPMTLAIGESTVVMIRFRATDAGTFDSTLTIISNDVNEATYLVGLTATSEYVDVSGNVFEDFDGDGQFGVHERGLADQSIYIDTNDNDILDIVQQDFLQDTPMNIVDSQTRTSTLIVSGVSATISDVNVRINATHSYVSDVDIFLISPSGARVLLASDVGGNGDNFTNTVFDDEAALSITSGVAPFTGSFRPQGVLTDFDGESANGPWQIEITDFFAGDEGVLLDWTLTFSTPEPLVRSDPFGFYYFDALPSGTYQFRSETTTGWTSTAPVGNEYEVTINEASDHFEPLDFGMAANDRFYGRVIEDQNANGELDPGDVGLAGHELFIDLNDNGQFDGPVTTNWFNGTDVVLPNIATVTSTVTPAGLSGRVLDVNVRVNITHSWDEDMDVFLIGPDGTRVELFTDVGGSSDDFTNTILDDDATMSITDGIAPFTGVFRPEGSLADFIGGAPNGTWTLELFDDTSPDAGLLNEWELILTHGEYAQSSDSMGNAIFDLTSGTSVLQLTEEIGWDFTLPSNGRREVVASGTPLFESIFGVQVEVINHPPTDVLLSIDTVVENTSTATPLAVGVLSSIDEDSGDSHSYLLAAGMGADDNALFQIDADILSVRSGVVLDYETRPSYQIRIRSTDAAGEFVEREFEILVADLAEVVGITIGNGTAQRSVVRQLVVEFDKEVVISSGAFEVNKRGTGGGAVDVLYATDLVGGRTVATLTFTGGFTVSGSLVDGNYDLRIDASKIVDLSDNWLDGDLDGIAGGDRYFGTAEVDQFFRLFGDTSGNRNVNLAEFNQFRGSFGRSSGDPNYANDFDFNNDGLIALTDFNQFRSRFGQSLGFA